MSHAIKNKIAAEEEDLFDKFRRIIASQEAGTAESLGKFAVFAGVAGFPARVKCAALAWHTFHAALEGRQIASTE